MHVTKRIDLGLLGRELAAASVVVNGLGLHGSDTDGDLFQWSAPDQHGTAQPLELPPAAAPIVDAHTAPLVVYEYIETRAVSSRFTTTDATFKEIYRLTTTPQRTYRATLNMAAIDAASMDVKDSEARLVYKHTDAALVQVGSTVALGTAQDAAASAWAIQAQVQASDLVIGVRGAAGRTIDWTLKGDIVVFAPGGLGA